MLLAGSKIAVELLMKTSSNAFSIISGLTFSMSEGLSVAASIAKLGEESASNFQTALKSLVKASDREAQLRIAKEKYRHPHQQIILEMVLLGLDGHPIFEKLKELENQIVLQDSQFLDRHHKTLPYKAMLPIFVLVVPGYFILLFGFLYAYLKERGI